jgi:hypothetical protein
MLNRLFYFKTAEQIDSNDKPSDLYLEVTGLNLGQDTG